jgi:hypothetical protein
LRKAFAQADGLRLPWALFVIALVRWVRQREKSSEADVSWLDIEARFKALEQLNLQHKGDGPVHAFESDTVPPSATSLSNSMCGKTTTAEALPLLSRMIS